MRGFYLIFLFLFFIIQCKEEAETTLSKEKMAEVLLDIAISDQIINVHSPDERDSMRVILKESLLKVHNLSDTELESNLYLYMSDFDAFDEVLDLMITKNDTLTARLEN